MLQLLSSLPAAALFPERPGDEGKRRHLAFIPCCKGGNSEYWWCHAIIRTTEDERTRENENLLPRLTMNAARLILVSLTFLHLAKSVFAQGSFSAMDTPDGLPPMDIILQGDTKGCGWSFIPTVDILITDLGVGNNGGNYDVTLWTSSFLPLRSVSIAPPWEQTGDTFAPISPITLFAGNSYYVGAEIGGGDAVGFAKMYFVGASLAPQLQGFANYGIHTDGTWHPRPGYNTPVLGPTFRFEAVPEPSVGVLLTLGVGLISGLCLKRRGKRTA